MTGLIRKFKEIRLLSKAVGSCCRMRSWKITEAEEKIGRGQGQKKEDMEVEFMGERELAITEEETTKSAE